MDKILLWPLMAIVGYAWWLLTGRQVTCPACHKKSLQGSVRGGMVRCQRCGESCEFSEWIFPTCVEAADFHMPKGKWAKPYVEQVDD